MPISIKKYETELKRAIRAFWETREVQTKAQQKRNVRDQGTRGAVTGGQQLNGFIKLFKKISIDVGIPEKFIFIKGNELPGYFRPTKNWDFIITSPKKHLIACIEFKSQVGSFGNNFNNRTEEALGNAIDIWTAFREGAFPNQLAPWLGFMMIVEKSIKSTTPVKVNEPYFKVFPEFKNASYLERYGLLCKKLIKERHYNASALVWTNLDSKGKAEFGFMNEEVSFEMFFNSYIGFLEGRLLEFKE